VEGGEVLLGVDGRVRGGGDRCREEWGGRGERRGCGGGKGGGEFYKGEGGEVGGKGRRGIR